MSAEARRRCVLQILDALSDPKITMAEGQPHRKAKGRAIDMLGLHFGAIGRTIYLAEELAVLYPGEVAFVPDILAVVDVPQPEDDQRMAWVVVEEGRGLDMVLEVLDQGDRKKDLVDNVDRYARLGIPEYFIYDRARGKVHGYRLPSADARRYQPIVPQFGRYKSTVLGLDLAVAEGRLQFFHGMAELFGSTDLIGRLRGMVDSLEAKAKQAEQEVEQATASLRAALLSFVAARGMSCTDEDRRRIESCTNLATLQRWLLRATTVSSMAAVFEGED